VADGSGNMTRQDFVKGVGGAGVGGLVVGGVIGGVIGRSTADSGSSSSSSSTGSSTSAAGATANTSPYTIACTFPLTGALASDGEQMKNGVTLAADEINAAGGINGRKIQLKILDMDVVDGAKIKAGIQQAISLKPDALYHGYIINWPEMMDLVGNSGIPCLNASTSIGQVQQIQGSEKYQNIFQIDPPEIYYGLGYPPFLNDLKAEGTWKPANSKIYIVEGDSVYSQTISKKAQEAAPGAGWQIAGVTKVTAGQADWSPSVKAAVDSGAAAVMNTHFAPDDLAKWTKAWVANPSKALVYLQYGPSIPAFTQLAGPAANGVIWATVTGVYDDAYGKVFRDSYQSKFGKPAGFSNSGSGYDAVNMLAKVWGQVDAKDHDAVRTSLRKLIHRGVNGGYWLSKNAGLAYPVETPDAGLGQAHLFFQIQGSELKHTIIKPAPYVEGKFQNAPWMA
jgi:branched-chain amino acid transport system substrate-binding protein